MYDDVAHVPCCAWDTTTLMNWLGKVAKRFDVAVLWTAGPQLMGAMTYLRQTPHKHRGWPFYSVSDVESKNPIRIRACSAAMSVS